MKIIDLLNKIANGEEVPDAIKCEIELRKEQLETFMQIAKEINKKSTYQFSYRKKLEEEYMKWVEQEKVANCPFNVISFLEMKDLLNREKVVKFLESKGE